jgi:hypothetical protein
MTDEISVKEACAFLSACLRLRFALEDTFDQVDVHLCEDLETVMLSAYDRQGNFALASFNLDEKVTEDFDLDPIKQAFRCNR